MNSAAGGEAKAMALAPFRIEPGSWVPAFAGMTTCGRRLRVAGVSRSERLERRPVDDLTHLGRASALPASPEVAVLDYVPNPRADLWVPDQGVAAYRGRG